MTHNELSRAILDYVLAFCLLAMVFITYNASVTRKEVDKKEERNNQTGRPRGSQEDNNQTGRP